MSEYFSEYLTEIIRKHMNYWPISKLGGSKVLKSKEDYKIKNDFRMPNYDKFDLLFFRFSLLIPFEEIDNAIKISENISENFGDSFRFRRINKKINRHNKFKVKNISWSLLASFRFKDRYKEKYNYEYLTIKMIRISESFACLLFLIRPTDEFKYLFNKIIKNTYKEKTILKKPKIKNIFNYWGSRTYSSRHIFLKNQIDNLNNFRKEFVEFLNGNKLNFYLGDKYKISTSVIINFRKDKDLNKLLYKNFDNNKYIDFWSAFNINDNYYFFSNENLSYIIPFYSINDNKSDSNIDYLFVAEEKINCPEMYHDFSSYIMNHLGDSIKFNIIKSIITYLDYVYSRIKDINKSYYSEINSEKQIIKNLLKFKEEMNYYNYWVKIFEKEFDIDWNYIDENNLSNILKYKFEDEFHETWFEVKMNNIEDKIKKLIYMFEIISEKIETSKDISVIESNHSLQNILILLTLITILLGFEINDSTLILYIILVFIVNYIRN